MLVSWREKFLEIQISASKENKPRAVLFQPTAAERPSTGPALLAHMTETWRKRLINSISSAG